MGFGKASLFGARRDSNVSSVNNQTRASVRKGVMGAMLPVKNEQRVLRTSSEIKEDLILVSNTMQFDNGVLLLMQFLLLKKNLLQ